MNRDKKQNEKQAEAVLARWRQANAVFDGPPHPLDEARLRKAIALAKKRVRFGRATSLSNIPNDTKTIEVLIDGQYETEITISMTDIGGAIHIYRVGGYYFDDDEITVDGVDQKFGDNRDLVLRPHEMGSPGAAKAKLVLAKQRVILTVAYAMMNAGTA